MNIENQNMKIQITPDKILKCKKCGSNLFTLATLLVKISALQSPTGQEGIAPIDGGFICVNCNTPFEEKEDNVEQKDSKLVDLSKSY